MSEYDVLEDIPDAVLVVDQDGSIVDANVHAESLFGYRRGELKGLSIEVLLPERFRKQHIVFRGQYGTAPSARPMGTDRELCGLRRDGTEFQVEVAIGPASRSPHILTLVRDVSVTVQARAALEASERRFRVVAQSTVDLIWEADEPNNKITWFGDIDGLLGYAPGEFPRTISGWLESIHPQDTEKAQQVVEHAIKTGEYIDSSYRIRSKDGSYLYWQDRGAVTDSVDGRPTKAVGAISDLTDRLLAQRQLERALAEIEELKNRLQAESAYLQTEIKNEHNFEEIVGNSLAMRTTLRKVELVAETDSTVLLLGETGTGKELLARAIHARGPRSHHPLIKVDCASLPAGLIESELFGHEKGAFTGANRTNVGRFELADEGTIFLDEVGELPMDLQSNLLRVLEEGEVRRLGSSRERKVDVRVIAATNRNLKEEVSEGRFRSDLYYRLSVFPVESPSLRERTEDIPLLVAFFLAKYAAALGKEIHSVSSASMEALINYSWPGNVRELRNVIERSVILCSGDVLIVEETLGDFRTPSAVTTTSLKQDLDTVERSKILRALEQSNWTIKGPGNAADRLGLKPSTLRSRMQRLGIRRPEGGKRCEW